MKELLKSLGVRKLTNKTVWPSYGFFVLFVSFRTPKDLWKSFMFYSQVFMHMKISLASQMFYFMVPPVIEINNWIHFSVYKATVSISFSFFLKYRIWRMNWRHFFRIKSRRYSRALIGCIYRPIRLGQLDFHKLLLGQIEML